MSISYSGEDLATSIPSIALFSLTLDRYSSRVVETGPVADCSYSSAYDIASPAQVRYYDQLLEGSDVHFSMYVRHRDDLARRGMTYGRF